MSTFYKIYVALCAKKGLSPSRVALELGFSKASVTRWKQNYQPTDASLSKISDYFGVTVEYLKGQENKNTPPVNENEERIAQIYKLTEDLSEAEIMALKSFVAGLKANRKPD